MASPCKSQLLFIALFFIIANQATCRELHESTNMDERHKQWMEEHGKVYKDEEEKLRRFQIFKNNVEFIESFNAAGDKPYKLGLNQFADLTNEEFRASWTGYKRPLDSSRKVTPFKYANITINPLSSMDWRKKNVVTKVKDQAQCGSGWAFSAVGAIEGIHKLAKGVLISLSKQELVDCDTKGEDKGCEGGQIENAFIFIVNNRGITSEINYPYKGTDGNCNQKKVTNRVAKISGYERVPSNSEEALMKAVANQPVSVSIDASSKTFQFYKSGVYTGSCGTNLNQGVLVVGYGRLGATKHWIVKNSWGIKWGENGYVRMERDISSKGGLCGIAMDCSYPIA